MISVVAAAMVRETARQQVRDIKVRRHVPEHRDRASKVARCLCTDVSPREASSAEIIRKS